MDNSEAMYWLAILHQANEGSKEAQEKLQQENELRVESGQPTVQEALKQKAQQAANPHINRNPNEKDLNKLLMSDGKQTAQEWLMTQPEAWREIETAAIYECLKRGWPLHTMSIQSTARELAVPGNPNGW